eukprot:15443519-Alexandrium_andersonii.AAC.1
MGVDAQLDEAWVSASPKGRAVLSKAWNSPKVGDPAFRLPALGAPREARRPQDWALRLGTSNPWRIP